MIPVLSLDVVQLIADKVGELVDHENFGRTDFRARREAGRDLALVCKDWKEVGERVAWKKVYIDLSKVHEGQEAGLKLLLHLLQHDHLARFVQKLGICSRKEATIDPLELSFFRILIEKCPALTSLSQVAATPAFTARLLTESVSALQNVTYMGLDSGGSETYKGPFALLQSLCAFPQLRRLLLILSEPQESPESPLPNLPGHCLNLSSISYGYILIALNGGRRLPTDYLHYLLHLVEPTSLRNLEINYSGEPGLILSTSFYLDLPAFLRLTNLTMILADDPPKTVFPLLTPILPLLLSLQHFELVTNTATGAGETSAPDPSWDASAALEALLQAFPPSVVTVNLGYRLEAINNMALLSSFLDSHLGQPLKLFSASIYIESQKRHRRCKFERTQGKNGETQWLVKGDYSGSRGRVK